MQGNQSLLEKLNRSWPYQTLSTLSLLIVSFYFLYYIAIGGFVFFLAYCIWINREQWIGNLQFFSFFLVDSVGREQPASVSMVIEEDHSYYPTLPVDVLHRARPRRKNRDISVSDKTGALRLMKRKSSVLQRI